MRFLAAAGRGDLDTVKRLLAFHPLLLGARDGEGRSVYALALLGGHQSVGNYLHAQGYLADVHEAALAQDWERFDALTTDDVSAVNRDHPIGGTAMYAAATSGAGLDMWRVYAVTGDPSAVPSGTHGASPLQAALRYRDLPAAEMTAATLLGNDADPNPPSNADDPPLHIAAARGSEVMVEMLIRRGAALGAKNRKGQTLGQVAELAGNAQVAALLARHAEIPRTHSTSRSAFDAMGRAYRPPDISNIPLVERRRFVGQSHGNLEYVKKAVAAEPRMVHSVATTSEICVEACAHTGRKAVADFLLEHGSAYSLPTAVMRDDKPRVERLLDEDPLRIYERGAHDFALLWYPIIGKCDLEMMELLLERGADVEQQHFLGTTALHWASIRGPIELVDLLIANGGDVNRKGRKFDAAGETPLEAAMAHDNQEIAQLLRQRGARA